MKGSIYEVTKVAGDKLLLSDIISWVWIDDVEKVSANTVVSTDNTFLVKIICDELNIRQKADFNSEVIGVVKKGEVLDVYKRQVTCVLVNNDAPKNKIKETTNTMIIQLIT